MRSNSIAGAWWTTLLAGQLTLFVALNIQLYAVCTQNLQFIQHALVAYIIGAAFLTVPPFIDARTAQDEGQQQFPKLLLLLQSFLIISGLLFFWEPDAFWEKIALRALTSIVVTLLIKFWLRAMPEMDWTWFLPWNLVRKYLWPALTGRLPAAYPLGLGIDFLGAGYAFMKYPVGSVFLMVGGAYLFVSAFRSFLDTGSKISAAWSILNFVFVVYGAIFAFVALS